jgi:hypothetical protein
MDDERRTVMRKLAFVLAAAGTLSMIVPAAAQVYVDRDYDRSWHRGPSIGFHFGDRTFGFDRGRRFGDDCRVVKVRRELPDGSVIVRTRRICD